MMLLALGFNFATMACLSLAMKRHHRQVLTGEPGTGRVLLLRLLAAAMGLLGLWLCVAALAAQQGVLVWLCLLMLAALLQGVLLAWRPRWVRLAAPLGLLAGALLALL